MSLNFTLVGQIITFLIFVWFTMKYVWPPLTKAMEERQKRIADGLEAADRGQRELEIAHKKAKEILQQAKVQAVDVLEQANKRSEQILEEARHRADEESDRLIAAANAEIDQAVNSAKESLRHEVAKIAIAGAEKILEKEIDGRTDHDLVDKLMVEL